MIEVDYKEVEDLARDMRTFAKRTFPFAVKDTVNTAALDTMKRIKDDLPQKFTLRNKRTVAGVHVKLYPKRGLNADKMVSYVGSYDDYMARQEDGGSVAKKGKHGVPIATSYAGGLPPKTIPRTKLPTDRNKLKNLKMPRGIRGANKRQRQRVSIMVAAKTGRKNVFLDTGKTKGIYRVLKRGKKHVWIKMLYNLSHPVVTTPKRPWLDPAMAETSKKMPQIFHAAMVRQLRLNRLFGY